MSRLRAARAAPDAAMLRPDARVLVTGGAGFVGSHLVETLLARGHRVHAVDDLTTGSRGNLAKALAHSAFRLTVGSIADAEIAEAACRDADCAFHLAGVVGVRRLAREPFTVIDRNLRATEVVLAAAAAARTPILVASSSEVYGDGPVPFREDAPLRPGSTEGLRGGYACAKAMGEWLALAHGQEHGLPVAIARLFNTVGPRQSAAGGMVLPRFTAQAVRGEPLTVYGDGSQTRCFADVREVAQALADLMQTPGVAGRVVNVGSAREVSILELARIVAAAAGGTAPIAHVPLGDVFPEGFVDPPRRVPCLRRLRAAIGRVPSRPVEAIAAELVALARADQEASMAAGTAGASRSVVA